MATVIPTTSPEPVISLERAKLHCKIAGTDRDAELVDAVEAARAWAQEFTQRAIGEEQTMSHTFYEWCGDVVLPFAPSEIVSVEDASGPIDYQLSGKSLTAAGASPVSVEYKVRGYSETTLPAPIKQAMLLMVGDFIANQQGQVETQLYENRAVISLLWPYRTGLGV